MTDVQLSQAAYDRLRAELDDLTTVGRTQIARTIETARELGDLKENGDYHAAKDQQGKMEARIRQLAAMLERATIRYEGDSDTERYLIGSIEERADMDVISPGSPLGTALMGAAPGDVISYTAPTGAVLKVEVVGIE
jgi:transcription elongation factor GreA